MADSEKYWESLSKKIQDPSETKNKRPDTSDLEVEFISKYLQTTDELLDLGSGSGLITNKLIEKVATIVAVEKFEGFTRFIKDDPKVLVINADILGFKIRKSFDAILCLGVAQYFKRPDALSIYKNCFQMLKEKGVFIVRMHCGLEKDKIVNGFSEELQTEYFAEYRQVGSEIKLLNDAGFKNVTKYDILPDSLNVWEDTRHFIFVCKKG